MYKAVPNNLGLPMKARRLISNGVLGYILTKIFLKKPTTKKKLEKNLATGRSHIDKILC
jgi:hypothetical protein